MVLLCGGSKALNTYIHMIHTCFYRQPLRILYCQKHLQYNNESCTFIKLDNYLPATNKFAVALCSPCLSVSPHVIFVLLFCSVAVTLIVLLTSGGASLFENVNPLYCKEPSFLQSTMSPFIYQLISAPLAWQKKVTVLFTGANWDTGPCKISVRVRKGTFFNSLCKSKTALL